MNCLVIEQIFSLITIFLRKKKTEKYTNFYMIQLPSTYAKN